MLVWMKTSGSSIERSTCVSAAKLIMARGLYCWSKRATRVLSPISPWINTWSLSSCYHDHMMIMTSYGHDLMMLMTCICQISPSGDGRRAIFCPFWEMFRTRRIIGATRPNLVKSFLNLCVRPFHVMKVRSKPRQKWRHSLTKILLELPTNT